MEEELDVRTTIGLGVPLVEEAAGLGDEQAMGMTIGLGAPLWDGSIDLDIRVTKAQRCWSGVGIDNKP